jgi:hypothetical protein
MNGSLVAQNFNLQINEIVTSNQTGQLDEFLEYDDWIEIYNPPGNPVTNLAGYFLSDNPDTLTKWMIPGGDPALTAVIPNGFIAFWIDNDFDNLVSQGANHTAGFKLSSDGEMLILTAPDSVSIIDSVSFPEMADDISYGRTCESCTGWQYFNHVTFEAPNQEVLQNHLLFFNEIQIQNASTYDDAQHEFDPWIEIFNPNPFQVNLAGYSIVADNNTPWTISNERPASSIIPAQGFALIWCDSDTTDDITHVPITLVNSGSLQLLGPVNSEVIDSYTYPVTSVNESYGRSNDGSSQSQTFTIPTPTVTNQLVIISPEDIVINEILTANQNDSIDEFGELEDWIELYNPNEYPVNVAGYYLSDNHDRRNKWMIPTLYPDSTVIPSMGFLLFWADDDENQGVRHTGFKLKNNGEYLCIASPDGYTLADEIEWGYIAPDTSFGRSFDASPEWILFPSPTPNATNGNAIAVNEIIPDGLKVYPNPVRDRIYLSNTSSVVVFNLVGEKVYSNNSASQIDVSAWPLGWYMLRVGEQGVYKIIVQ